MRYYRNENGTTKCTRRDYSERKYDTSEVFEFCENVDVVCLGHVVDTSYINGFGFKLLEEKDRKVCRNCFNKIDYFDYDQKALALLNETRIKMKELNKEFFGEE